MVVAARVRCSFFAFRIPCTSWCTFRRSLSSVKSSNYASAPKTYNEALRKRKELGLEEGGEMPDPTVMAKDVLRLRIRAGRGGDGIARSVG